jgi:branched-chain amino acid transport system permease protein
MTARIPLILQLGTGLALVLVAGAVAPDWLTFLFVIALAKGLAACGVVVLLRGGLLSFGQGLFYCAGAYGAGLAMTWGRISDALLLVLIGGCAAVSIALAVGPLLARYRKIFFATLTLAVSMLAYGALTKTDALGGTDGLNLVAPTFLGFRPKGASQAVYATLVLAGLLAVGLGALIRIHFDSIRGFLALGLRDNEIRVEYLGGSARRVAFDSFVLAAMLGGIGGALNALVLGHIDPELGFWTTSGEFVVVAILAGYASVTAVFAASVIVELLRSYATQYFPNEWQMALGLFLLGIILFLPDGIGSILVSRRGKKVQSR